MNKLFWILMFVAATIKAEQTITIDNTISAEISNNLKIQWYNTGGGNQINYNSKNNERFPDYNLKPGNQSVKVPEEANSFDCNGTTNKIEKINNKFKNKCNLSLAGIKTITQGGHYTLKASDKCEKRGATQECFCDIIVE